MLDSRILPALAYGLLRSILGTAVQDGLLAANPCHIRGAGAARRVHEVKPRTVPELATLVNAMPDRYRLLVLLAAWCGLRFGELAELRRRDVDLTNRVLHVRRGVILVDGQVIVGPPKTTAGVRDVAVPPHLLPELREHVNSRITGGRDGLLFLAADGLSHLAPSTLYRVFYPARERGRPDLRWHDLRHTGAVLAAQSGATLADLMHRLGHSTPAAAMRYEHAAARPDRITAAALSTLAEADTKCATSIPRASVSATQRRSSPSEPPGGTRQGHPGRHTPRRSMRGQAVSEDFERHTPGGLAGATFRADAQLR